MTGIFYSIGVGPGDPELITVKAIKTMESCQVIAVPVSSGDEQVAYEIAAQAVPSLREKMRLALDMPMSRDRDVLAKSHREAAEQVMTQLAAGHSVAFLTLGDPSIYATSSYVQEIVAEQGYPVVMIPGVPSFCAVAARLNMALVKSAEALHIIPASYQGLEEALDYSGTKVLMKAGKSLGKVKQALTERDLAEQTFMVQKCGMVDEQIYRGLEEVDEKAGYFSTLIVKEQEGKG